MCVCARARVFSHARLRACACACTFACTRARGEILEGGGVCLRGSAQCEHSRASMRARWRSFPAPLFHDRRRPRRPASQTAVRGSTCPIRRSQGVPVPCFGSRRLRGGRRGRLDPRAPDGLVDEGADQLPRAGAEGPQHPELPQPVPHVGLRPRRRGSRLGGHRRGRRFYSFLSSASFLLLRTQGARVRHP